MSMSGAYGSVVEKKDMISLLRAAVERGVAFFDTAQVYGPFANEELVGEALAPFLGQVVIATKFGFKFEHNGAPRMVGLDSRPDYIKQGVEGSLKRLRVDAIDLFYPLRSEERPDVAVRADASTGVFANASSDSAVSAARPANDSGPRVVLRSADAKAAKTRSAIRCRVRQSRI